MRAYCYGVRLWTMLAKSVSLVGDVGTLVCKASTGSSTNKLKLWSNSATEPWSNTRTLSEYVTAVSNLWAIISTVVFRYSAILKMLSRTRFCDSWSTWAVGSSSRRIEHVFYSSAYARLRSCCCPILKSFASLSRSLVSPYIYRLSWLIIFRPVSIWFSLLSVDWLS